MQINDDNSEKRDDRDYLLIQHNAYLQDIKNTKEWQWLLSYYIILLFGAVIWITEKIADNSPNNCYLMIFSLFCGVAIALLGIYSAIQLHKDLSKYRKEIDSIAERLKEPLGKLGSSNFTTYIITTISLIGCIYFSIFIITKLMK